MTLNRALMFVGLLACANSGAAEDSADRSLAACMDRAWEVSWQRFYLPKTNLFYDYLSSYEPGRELVHLPTAAEVARQYPNECGYGTGMEDCMISAGVMLSLIVDRYAVTKDETLRDRALQKPMSEILARISQRCAGRALRADASAPKLDLTMTCSDWRSGEGLSPKGK